MRVTHRFAIAMLCALVGCGTRATVPSSPSTGSTLDVAATQEEVEAAVRRAFSNLRYHQTMLDAAKDFDLLSNWHVSNGFVLYPTLDPLGYVPDPRSTERTNQLPYYAYFHITFTQTVSNETKITVRTVFCEVLIGTRHTLHSSRAKLYLPATPASAEETNVLRAINEELTRPTRSAPKDRR